MNKLPKKREAVEIWPFPTPGILGAEGDEDVGNVEFYDVKTLSIAFREIELKISKKQRADLRQLYESTQGIPWFYPDLTDTSLRVIIHSEVNDAQTQEIQSRVQTGSSPAGWSI